MAGQPFSSVRGRKRLKYFMDNERVPVPIIRDVYSVRDIDEFLDGTSATKLDSGFLSPFPKSLADANGEVKGQDAPAEDCVDGPIQPNNVGVGTSSDAVSSFRESAPLKTSSPIIDVTTVNDDGNDEEQLGSPILPTIGNENEEPIKGNMEPPLSPQQGVVGEDQGTAQPWLTKTLTLSPPDKLTLHPAEEVGDKPPVSEHKKQGPSSASIQNNQPVVAVVDQPGPSSASSTANHERTFQKKLRDFLTPKPLQSRPPEPSTRAAAPKLQMVEGNDSRGVDEDDDDADDFFILEDETPILFSLKRKGQSSRAKQPPSKERAKTVGKVTTDAAAAAGDTDHVVEPSLEPQVEADTQAHPLPKDSAAQTKKSKPGKQTKTRVEPMPSTAVSGDSAEVREVSSGKGMTSPKTPPPKAQKGKGRPKNQAGNRALTDESESSQEDPIARGDAAKAAQADSRETPKEQGPKANLCLPVGKRRRPDTVAVETPSPLATHGVEEQEDVDEAPPSPSKMSKNIRTPVKQRPKKAVLDKQRPHQKMKKKKLQREPSKAFSASESSEPESKEKAKKAPSPPTQPKQPAKQADTVKARSKLKARGRTKEKNERANQRKNQRSEESPEPTSTPPQNEDELETADQVNNPEEHPHNSSGSSVLGKRRRNKPGTWWAVNLESNFTYNRPCSPPKIAKDSKPREGKQTKLKNGLTGNTPKGGQEKRSDSVSAEQDEDDIGDKPQGLITSRKKQRSRLTTPIAKGKRAHRHQHKSKKRERGRELPQQEREEEEREEEPAGCERFDDQVQQVHMDAEPLIEPVQRGPGTQTKSRLQQERCIPQSPSKQLHQETACSAENSIVPSPSPSLTPPGPMAEPETRPRLPTPGLPGLGVNAQQQRLPNRRSCGVRKPGSRIKRGLQALCGVRGTPAMMHGSLSTFGALYKSGTSREKTSARQNVRKNLMNSLEDECDIDNSCQSNEQASVSTGVLSLHSSAIRNNELVKQLNVRDSTPATKYALRKESAPPLLSGPSSMIELKSFENGEEEDEQEISLPSTLQIPLELSEMEICGQLLRPLTLAPEDWQQVTCWLHQVWRTTSKYAGQVMTADHFHWYTHQGGTLGHRFDLISSSYANGKILLGSYAHKPPQVDEHTTTIFNVITSSVRVQISDLKSDYSPGQAFIVSKGETYSIHNLTNIPAILWYHRMLADLTEKP